ncbi:MAG: NRDE family protein [Phycisphaerales bacterium]|nr:NRDE family protein [Phycisphaerales bacterium]
MCTVSVIALAPGALRLVTNRDESPERPRALAPRWQPRVWGDCAAVWPIDGLAAGTWVAAGEQGLTLALLNANLREPGPSPDPSRRLSRGGIIPQVMGQPGAPEASEALRSLELTRFEPFRLVASDISGESLRVIESLWDGRSLTRVDLGRGPACFASSGLGDWLVESRLSLFESMVVEAGATVAAQDAFHDHRWPERPEVSVMMDRGLARTVSVTRVEVRPAGVGGRFAVSMHHEPIGALGEPACRS